MKKVLLSLAIVATGLAAFAQKPAAGDKTIEYNLNFATGTGVTYGILSTTLPGVGELRGRYFLSEDMAARCKVGLGMGSVTTKSTGGAGNTITNTHKVSNGFSLALTPGIEKHFAGTDKLSPYVGAELPIGIGGSTTTEDDQKDATGTFATNNSTKTVTGSQFNLGLNLLIGADYYFTNSIYLGVEGGMGLFMMGSTGDGTFDNTTGGVVAAQVKTLGGSTFNLFGAFGGGVRFGYKF